MESWLTELRQGAELYLVLFSLLSQSVLIASTLLELAGRVMPQPVGDGVVAVLIAGCASVVLLADRLESLFLAVLRLARKADLRGWSRLGWLLRGVLGLLVTSSYLRPRGGQDATTANRDLHLAFLTIYSSDARYPRPGRRSRRRRRAAQLATSFPPPLPVTPPTWGAEPLTSR